MNKLTKLPMRKILDFIEMGRTTVSVSTADPTKFYNDLEKLATELEVEELALIGDAHYDGMSTMKELIESVGLIENTDSYVKEKFDKEFPEPDDYQDWADKNLWPAFTKVEL